MLTRRMFLGTTAAAVSARALPVTLKSPPVKRVLTLVYDKSIGAMRAVDRVIR